MKQPSYKTFIATPAPLGGPTPEERLEETLKSILRSDPNTDIAKLHAAVSKAHGAVKAERAAAEAHAHSESRKSRSMGDDGGAAIGLACGLF